MTDEYGSQTSTCPTEKGTLNTVIYTKYFSDVEVGKKSWAT